MNELITLKKIEQSKLAISQVKTLDEIKKIIDQGEALRAYARSAQLSAELQADISELNLRAQRRLGEISAELERKKGGDRRSINVRSTDIDNTKTAALAEVGVTRQRANEAEKLAAVPENVFEQKIAEAKEASEKITKSLFEEVQKKQRWTESRRAYDRVSLYRRTGVKPKGWIDGADDQLNAEADERKARFEALKNELEDREKREAAYQNDPYPVQFQKYLDGLDSDTHRIVVCKTIMRICRRTLGVIYKKK
jgi:hypothetical protein